RMVENRRLSTIAVGPHSTRPSGATFLPRRRDAALAAERRLLTEHPTAARSTPSAATEEDYDDRQHCREHDARDRPGQLRVGRRPAPCDDPPARHRRTTSSRPC